MNTAPPPTAPSQYPQRTRIRPALFRRRPVLAALVVSAGFAAPVLVLPPSTEGPVAEPGRRGAPGEVSSLPLATTPAPPPPLRPPAPCPPTPQLAFLDGALPAPILRSADAGCPPVETSGAPLSSR
jgi:hypothetical protein